MRKQELLPYILKHHFARETGLICYLGPLVLAQNSSSHTSTLIAVHNGSRSKRLALLGNNLQVVCARPLELPFEAQSFSGIIAFNLLSRLGSPEKTLNFWKTLLQPQGKLLIVEPLSFGSSPKFLHRLLHPRLKKLKPEDLTCYLMNAGFIQIVQEWPNKRPYNLFTSGNLKPLC